MAGLASQNVRHIRPQALSDISLVPVPADAVQTHPVPNSEPVALAVQKKLSLRMVNGKKFADTRGVPELLPTLIVK